VRTGAAILLTHDTPYHQVTVAERAGEASLFIDGLYQGALDDPYEDELVAAIVLTQHPAPREVLIVAPALSGPARAISSAAGVRATLVRADDRLDLIVGGELDRGGSGAATERVTADPRAAVRDWGRSAAASFDVIAILQGGAASGAGNRVSTSEFFGDCARVLRPGGLLAIAIPGAANVASPEGAAARAAVFGALGEVFADVRIAPGTTHQLFAALPRGGPGRPGARGAPAGDSPLTWEPDSLAARRARLRPADPPWPPRLFAQLLPAERVEHLRRDVFGALAAGVPANRDRRPIAYFAQIRLWDRLSGSGLSGMLSSWHRHPWTWSGGVLVLLAVGGLLLRRRHGPAAVSLASTGMVGMGADLLILLLYQTAVGTLYLNVGLVVAVFMCGLGAGALAGNRWRLRVRRAPALADLAWVALLLAWIPLLGLLPRLAPSAAEAAILALAALCGVLTALPFPWVAALLAQREADRRALARGLPASSDPAGGSRARVAAIAGGQADAIDHYGAFFGALLTGTLLVPLLGFTATLGLLAGVKLLSALAWVGGKPAATPRAAQLRRAASVSA